MPIKNREDLAKLQKDENPKFVLRVENNLLLISETTPQFRQVQSLLDVHSLSGITSSEHCALV